MLAADRIMFFNNLYAVLWLFYGFMLLLASNWVFMYILFFIALLLFILLFVYFNLLWNALGALWRERRGKNLIYPNTYISMYGGCRHKNCVWDVMTCSVLLISLVKAKLDMTWEGGDHRSVKMCVWALFLSKLWLWRRGGQHNPVHIYMEVNPTVF